MVVSPGVATTFAGTLGPEPAESVRMALEIIELADVPSAFRATTFTKYCLAGIKPSMAHEVALTVEAQDPALGVT